MDDQEADATRGQIPLGTPRSREQRFFSGPSQASRSSHHALKGGDIMDWEAPSFVEVKMDAEINSYQDDLADIPDIKEPAPEWPVMTAPQ